VKTVSFPFLDYENLSGFYSSFYSIGHVPSACRRAQKLDPKKKANAKGRKENEPQRVQNVYCPKDKPNKAQKDALEDQNVTGPTLPVADPEALETLFCTPRCSTLAEDPFRCGCSNDVPSNAPIVRPVIFSNVPIVPPADVPITHSHVAPIGGLDVASSTTMEDPVAAHMSSIHEGIILSLS